MTSGCPRLPLGTVKAVDNLIPDTPYSTLNFNTTMEVEEMNQLRKRLQQNIGFISANKPRIRHQEYTQLMNFHQMALNVLNNMVNVKQVEYSNPYNRNMRKFHVEGQPTPFHQKPLEAIYDDKGKVQIVDLDQRRQREEWEMQFDQNVINPPCYMLPPTGCFNPKTKNNR